MHSYHDNFLFQKFHQQHSSILNMSISYKTPLLVMYKYKSHWDTKMYKMQRKYFETILTQIVLHARCREAQRNYCKWLFQVHLVKQLKLSQDFEHFLSFKSSNIEILFTSNLTFILQRQKRFAKYFKRGKNLYFCQSARHKIKVKSNMSWRIIDKREKTKKLSFCPKLSLKWIVLQKTFMSA